MASSNYGFLHNESLPSEETIVARCKEIGFEVTGATLLDASSKVIAWIKYGPNVTVSEALTQDFVAKALAKSPGSNVQVPRVFHAFTWKHPAYTFGTIAMQYIEGADCDSGDVDIVAKAVQTLINIRTSSLTLGHVGGGYIVHSFFLEWIPVADYKSVEDLNAHINNILKKKKDSRRVDLVADTKGGLSLCLSDIHPRNFRKSIDGQLYAFDFGATCFMPPSFVGVAMRKSEDPFCYQVAQKIKYIQSEEVSAMVSASNYLVPFGHRAVAFPPGLKARRSEPWMQLTTLN